MTVTAEERRERAALWVGLLTTMWLLIVPLALVFGFFSLFSLTSEPNPAANRGAVWLLVAGVLGVLLPAIAATVAFTARRRVLGAVYLVLAILLLVPGGLVAASGLDILDGPDPAPARAPVSPGGCQEHSGGDTRCPGG